VQYECPPQLVVTPINY